MKSLSRIFRKSIKAVKTYGLIEFLRRTFIFIDRKIRPSKYFHTLQSIQYTKEEKFLLFVTGEPKIPPPFIGAKFRKSRLK